MGARKAHVVPTWVWIALLVTAGFVAAGIAAQAYWIAALIGSEAWGYELSRRD